MSKLTTKPKFAEYCPICGSCRFFENYPGDICLENCPECGFLKVKREFLHGGPAP